MINIELKSNYSIKINYPHESVSESAYIRCGMNPFQYPHKSVGIYLIRMNPF